MNQFLGCDAPNFRKLVALEDPSRACHVLSATQLPPGPVSKSDDFGKRKGALCQELSANLAGEALTQRPLEIIVSKSRDCGGLDLLRAQSG